MTDTQTKGRVKQPARPVTGGDPEVLAKLGVSRRRGARRLLGRLLLLAVFAAAGGGIWFWRVKASAPKTPSYVTAEVRRGDLRETVTATGTLSPLDAVEVGAEVTGRVTAVHVDINDRVTKDQVLVEIDTEQLKARVEESQAQLQNAQASQKNSAATVKEAEAKAARAREMHKRGLVSDQELETAEAALDRAKAAVSSAAAQTTVALAGLKSAKTSLGKAIIRSPIDGIVLARSVEVGQTVTAGFQTPILFTLARDLSLMQLRIDVDEADVGRVKEGLSATFVVDAFPKRTFSSKLVKLGNLPKPGTTVITYAATLTVDNAERLLKPGMTATATLVTNEKKDVLYVPNAALRFRPPAADAPKAAQPGLPIPGLGGNFRTGGRRVSGPRPEGVASKERLYLLRQGAPVPLTVEVGATDGRRTEVRGEGIAPGVQVVVDVAEQAP
jgi:HlyD family secretion protein